MIITNAPLVNHQTEYESEWVRAMDFRASLRGPQHKYDASVVNIELLHCTFFRNLINKGFPVIELRDGIGETEIMLTDELIPIKPFLQVSA